VFRAWLCDCQLGELSQVTWSVIFKIGMMFISQSYGIHEAMRVKHVS
jgi:hypothetical protein